MINGGLYTFSFGSSGEEPYIASSCNLKASLDLLTACATFRPFLMLSAHLPAFGNSSAGKLFLQVTNVQLWLQAHTEQDIHSNVLLLRECQLLQTPTQTGFNSKLMMNTEIALSVHKYLS